MTDPIADLLTRIRNSLRARQESCVVPASQLKESILKILKERGYIQTYAPLENGPQGDFVIKLKYLPGGRAPLIHTLKRVSKPGRRIYRTAAQLKPLLGGLGLSIVSTSRGVLTDVEAKKQNVGGEVLCEVW